jgi:molybdate/tungstate transport system ATP-binding protein
MIAVRGLAIRQGSFALDAVGFAVPAGAYAVLMGASGSGKTTLIECLCGLRRPHSGRVIIADRDVTDLPPGRRGLGYVPQDSALFPAMRIGRQLDFALRLRGMAPSERAARVADLAGLLGIGHLLDRLPAGLSGGERQRIALARALSADSRVLLLDEPLAALDEDLHEELCGLLARIHRDQAVTVLHITHRRSEAVSLATLRLRLIDGRVERNPCAS